MEQARAREVASPPSANASSRPPGAHATAPPQGRRPAGRATAPGTGQQGLSQAAAPAAELPRVPEQARGEHTHSEHTHSEPAAPHPKTPRAPARRAHAPRTVQRHSVRGQILQALRTALVDGELVPGEVYSAPVLGERFGVSATPVREAMQQLANEGMVEVVPNRGFRVTIRGPRERAELAEVRALIEVPVMLRLARSVPAARWSELRPLAEATVTAAAGGDRAEYAEADRAFHRALLSLSGNDQLVQVADDLHRRSQCPLSSGPVIRRADLVADAAQHTALLEALMAEDLTLVRALIREHFGGLDA
ncbi:FCD domain-containing protein [Streptomyces sp. NPDC055078]